METELGKLRDEFAKGTPGTRASVRPDLHEHGLQNYAAWRLRKAWMESELLGPDHAVLLRQLARWSKGVGFASLPEPLADLLSQCGIRRSVDGVLTTEPFVPEWLAEAPAEGIDLLPEQRRRDERLLAELYLQELNYRHWASPAQREAVWMALTAPSDSTSLIALPTGAGKSLCFQALARFGNGLTVVVVPTVALAHDHLRSARDRFSTGSRVNPALFSAGEVAESVLDAVNDRSCRLLFTSPEACVSGRLRGALGNAARYGWLENLVIDEAHLIETWGMEFRVDFQMLSSLRRTWMQEPHSRLKTVLLSATFTSDCRATLRGLYWDVGTQWLELISQRLRPEIAYFRQSFDRGDERDRALLESMWYLPRPAVVYTTEVLEASRIYAVFRETGFRRIGCITGETNTKERARILEDWHSDRIDLMVATSAFGLGVDKPDVRAVVHACLPENLHRYYQEVGRGGRDGFTSVSLLLDSPRDRQDAKGLLPSLLRPETLERRWRSLWEAKVSAEDVDGYKLYLDTKPLNLFGDQTYGENVRWNKRLILQLLRASLIELVGYEVEYPADDVGEPRETCLVRLRFSPHTPNLGSMIQAQRSEELEQAKKGFDELCRYMDGRRCISFHLADLYGREQTARVCGGCQACREKGLRRNRQTPSLSFPGSPPSSPSLTVVTEAPTLDTNASSLARQLLQSGWKRFVCPDSDREAWVREFGEVDRGSSYQYRIDGTGGGLPFRVDEDERLAVLHGRRLLRSALDLRIGQQIVHLVGADPVDANGRHVLEAEGARPITWSNWDYVH